ITEPAGMPAAKAVAMLTDTSARKACTRSPMISTSSTATAAAAMPSSGPAPRVCVHSSVFIPAPFPTASLLPCSAEVGRVVRRARGSGPEPEPVERFRGDLLRRGRHVDGDGVAPLLVGCQGLEVGELGLQQRGRHEMPG